jgi:hypothetical protein
MNGIEEVRLSLGVVTLQDGHAGRQVQLKTGIIAEIRQAEMFAAHG